MADLNSLFDCFDEPQNDQALHIPDVKPEPEDL